MSSKDIAIKVENISKVYRIGLKQKMHDSFAGAILDFITSPLRNYRKYRSLYKFDDISSGQNQNPGNNSSDIIWALRNVSFEVKKGEVVAIIGRNGAGKSTFLKVLCKITDPTRGQAEIHGRVSSLLEVGTGFHPELTGRENVYLNGTILGMRKKEVHQKFDEIVDFSGVEKFIDTPVKRYSSGMKVRLAFAVAAHLEPEILIIDEVLAVGDADFQKKCLNKMQDVGQKGRTVLFVSHNMQAVTRLCDRTILLDEGRVVSDGPSCEVVNSYLNAQSGSMAVREWHNLPGSPGSDVVRLRGVRVRMEDGQISQLADIRKPVAIEMEYDVLRSGYVLMPHFHLHNAEGVHVFVTIDQDPTWRRRPRDTGHYVSTAWIPGNLLSEGMMYVSPALGTVAPRIPQFYERDAIAFNIVDKSDGDGARGDCALKLGGVVRPLLKWSTQFTPNP